MDTGVQQPNSIVEPPSKLFQLIKQMRSEASKTNSPWYMNLIISMITLKTGDDVAERETSASAEPVFTELTRLLSHILVNIVPVEMTDILQEPSRSDTLSPWILIVEVPIDTRYRQDTVLSCSGNRVNEHTHLTYFSDQESLVRDRKVVTEHRTTQLFHQRKQVIVLARGFLPDVSPTEQKINDVPEVFDKPVVIPFNPHVLKVLYGWRGLDLRHISRISDILKIAKTTSGQSVIQQHPDIRIKELSCRIRSVDIRPTEPQHRFNFLRMSVVYSRHTVTT